MRWGLLSTAMINHDVAGAARESQEAEVVAVASRELARAEAHAGEVGAERAYGSYDELLADPDLDAIYVSLPNSMHVEWATRALEAGKHVLCEKTFTCRAAEAEAAFDAAERNGRVLTEGFMWRHHPQVAKVLELVAGGAIGEVRALGASFSGAVFGPHDIRLRPELDGGALTDVGCYCVHGLRTLAGEPERVFAAQRVGPTGVDLVLSATMTFANGVVATFDCGLELPERARLEVVGDTGAIVLSNPWLAGEPSVELRRDDGAERIEAETANAYRLELEDLARAARGEKEPLIGRADVVAQARAIEALLASAARGEPVEL
ncbi:MAG: Gfo/Idh/MocA family oxidoreductase [Thermoleophilaceae bacterium]|nr:Gfo/Idh/MocA family oxidoreductase [Thermoleophilaceae bacterium]